MAISTKRIATLTLAAALICGFVFPSAGLAKPGGSELEKRIEQLAPEQQSRARNILEESRAANGQLREAVKAKRAEIDALMKEASPDRARLESLSKELGELRGKELVARLEMREKFKAAGIPDLRKDGKDGKEGRDLMVHDGKKGRDGRKGGLERGLEKLSPEQQAAARKIIDENRASTSATREALKARTAELDAQMKSETPDTTLVQKLSAEIGELKGRLLAARADLRQELAKGGIPSGTFERDVNRDGGRGDKKLK